jgi:hypothetical protein
MQIPQVIIEKRRATYAYRGADITPAATATDVLTLTGSANKLIRLTKIGLSGSATAASLQDLYIAKRLTANTAGTFTNPVAAKYDTLDPTASGIITLYTANPTALGTGSPLEGDKLYLPAAALPTAEPSHWNREYGLGEAQCPTVRGAAESICIGFGGAAIAAGASFYFYIEWTEEAI